jgi:LmbE family N-acetylglucosaminyl deacetylase
MALNGALMGIWAHPDDEAYLSAGLMAEARSRGQRVVVVTATDGESGGPSDDPIVRRRLARQRRRELKRSLAAVGVTEHVRLGYPDGGCDQVDELGATSSLARLISDVQPQTIVTFGPDGITGHPDHRAVSGWTRAAWESTGRGAALWHATLTPEFHQEWGPLNAEVGLWMDERYVRSTPTGELVHTVNLRGGILDQKMAALRAQESQTKSLIEHVGDETFASWWSTEWFVEAGPEAPYRLDEDRGKRLLEPV